jgi:4-amino-4-deoxy-L-arabinose transferase-like glycosyltransferase
MNRGRNGARRMTGKIDKKLLSIFLLALLLRVFFGIAIHEPTDRGDMLRYESLALEGGFTVHQEPLYPLLLRLLYRAFGIHNYSAVFVIQGIASSSIVFLMYALTRNLFGRKAALIAALTSALYPNFILYGLAVLPEALIVPLVASMAAILSAGRRDAREACCEGVLAGIGILLKPSLVFLVPGLLVFLKRRFLFLLALAIVVAPWIIRNAIVFDRLVPIYGASSFDISFDLYSSDWQYAVDALYSRAITLYQWHWGDNALRQGGVSGANAVYLIRKFSYLTLLLVGCVGMARYIKREHLRAIMPLLGSVLIQLMITRVYSMRFRVLLEIPLIVYTGMLMSRIRGAGRID